MIKIQKVKAIWIGEAYHEVLRKRAYKNKTKMKFELEKILDENIDVEEENKDVID